MTKYAHLDGNSPSHVIGFYDTDFNDYTATLPPLTEMVIVPDADWQKRVTSGSWTWVNGRLVALGAA